MKTQWNGTIQWQLDSCRDAIVKEDEKNLVMYMSKLGENLINILHMAEKNPTAKTFYQIKLAAKKYSASNILSRDYSRVLELSYNIYKSCWYIDAADYEVSFEELKESFEEIEELFTEVEMYLHNKGII